MPRAGEDRGAPRLLPPGCQGLTLFPAIPLHPAPCPLRPRLAVFQPQVRVADPFALQPWHLVSSPVLASCVTGEDGYCPFSLTFPFSKMGVSQPHPPMVSWCRKGPHR